MTRLCFLGLRFRGLRFRGLWSAFSRHPLYDASAVFYQLSYRANWELVIIWVHDKLVDSGYQSNQINLLLFYKWRGLVLNVNLIPVLTVMLIQLMLWRKKVE